MTSDEIVEAAADYRRTLADHILTTLNPPASDGDEAARCMDAITAIRVYVEMQECRCASRHASCDRCRVLGRHYGEPVQR